MNQTEPIHRVYCSTCPRYRDMQKKSISPSTNTHAAVGQQVRRTAEQTHTHTHTQHMTANNIPSSASRPRISCLVIFALSMAINSTSHVGGWVPSLSHHLTSPSCTVSSIVKGWALAHAAIVTGSSPTPLRTSCILLLFLACLLTYFLKSMGYTVQSVAKKSKTLHIHIPYRWWGQPHSPVTFTLIPPITCKSLPCMGITYQSVTCFGENLQVDRGEMEH